jgi:hypothetical protein
MAYDWGGTLLSETLIFDSVAHDIKDGGVSDETRIVFIRNKEVSAVADPFLGELFRFRDGFFVITQNKGPVFVDLLDCLFRIKIRIGKNFKVVKAFFNVDFKLFVVFAGGMAQAKSQKEEAQRVFFNKVHICT